MMSKIEVAAAGYFQLTLNNCLKSKKGKVRNPKNRRWWMVSLHHSRARYGGDHLLADLVREPSGQFDNFCRMSLSDFENLLCKIGPSISKQDTKWRKSIPIKVRLAVTLRFLATGDSYQSLHFTFKMSRQVISLIIPEVCTALIDTLEDYVKVPCSEQEWLQIASKFESKWQFPHCIGALDGKHVTFQCPDKSGSTYYNYKGTYSIVLLGLADSEYNFIYADVGCQGRISDGGVFQNSTLYEKLYGNATTIPQARPIARHTNINMPYVIVADDAFALSTRLLKPYPGVHKKGSPERNINYRLSRARMVIENTFGILSAVFRVLKKPMQLQPEKAKLITLTCVYLHNFLRKSKTSTNIYTALLITCPMKEKYNLALGGAIQIIKYPLQRVGRKPNSDAARLRDEYTNYFMTTGIVDWQERYS